MKIPNIKEFLLTLRPSPGKVEGVESLEASIHNLAETKAAAIQQIDELKGARALAALEEDDAAFIRAERSLATIKIFVEKCDAELPAVQARLEAARHERRQTAWRDFAQRHLNELQKFIDLYRQALSARNCAIQIRADANAAGFEDAARCFPMSLMMFGEPELTNIENEMARLRASNFHLPRPAPAALPRPGPHFEHRYMPPERRDRAVSLGNISHNFVAPHAAPQLAKPIVPKLTEPTAPPNPPRLHAPHVPKHEVAGEGEVLMLVLRSGYESPKSGPCARGDVIALLAKLADRAFESNAITYYVPGTPAKEGETDAD